MNVLIFFLLSSSSSILSTDYMVIYGGAGNAGTIFQDVYSIDLKTSKCYGTLKKNSGKASCCNVDVNDDYDRDDVH